MLAVYRYSSSSIDNGDHAMELRDLIPPSSYHHLDEVGVPSLCSGYAKNSYEVVHFHIYISNGYVMKFPACSLIQNATLDLFKASVNCVWSLKDIL